MPLLENRPRILSARRERRRRLHARGARLRKTGRRGVGRGSVGGWCLSKCAGTLFFDEIEKAHPRILDVSLQVLDAARFPKPACIEEADHHLSVPPDPSRWGHGSRVRLRPPRSTSLTMALGHRPQVVARGAMECLVNGSGMAIIG